MRIICILSLASCVACATFFAVHFLWAMLAYDGIIYASIDSLNEGWFETALLTFVSIFGFVGLFKYIKH
jgi:hypothetical protein